jgi:ferredoxin
MCKVGCIACGICAKQSDVFSVTDNLAKIDDEKYQPDEKTEAAYNKCPTCVIVYRGKTAPPPREPAAKKAAAAS